MILNLKYNLPYPIQMAASKLKFNIGEGGTSCCMSVKHQGLSLKKSDSKKSLPTFVEWISWLPINPN